MAVTIAELRAMMPAVNSGVPDALLTAALGYAEDRVHRAYGPGYDPARPMMEATWHSLYYEPWPLELSFPHPVDTIHSLVVNDTELSTEDYALTKRTGRIVLRHYFVWSTRAVCRYTPRDTSAMRDAVLLEVAALYLSRFSRILPVVGQAEAGSWRFDPRQQEDLALNRLQTRIIAKHLPQSIEYVDPGEGG